MATVALTMETGKRWWFRAAWVLCVLLCRLCIVSCERAAHWLARNGLWYRVVALPAASESGCIGAPARYSVGQPDFDQKIGARLRIYLDGVRVEQVIAYDCQAGTVERYATDERGTLKVDRARGTAITETLRGSVTAELA